MNINDMQALIRERKQEIETLNEQIRKAKFRVIWMQKDIESLQDCIDEIRKQKTDAFDEMLKGAEK